MIHLYCLAVQAGFHSDAVECSPVTQTVRVRSPAAALVIRIFHLLHLDLILINITVKIILVVISCLIFPAFSAMYIDQMH